MGVWANRREEPAEKQVGGVAWQDEELEVALHCRMRLPMSMLHDEEHVDADGEAGASAPGTEALASREEEEGLFKADAVNEEDPERDRATQV